MNYRLTLHDTNTPNTYYQQISQQKMMPSGEHKGLNTTARNCK